MNLGRRGEQAGARFLKSLGYRIVERNYRCPAGEIDVIARDGDTIVFVEIKTRGSTVAADPEQAVDRRKRSALTRAARYYLRTRNAEGTPCRFDILAVEMPGSRTTEVVHIVDAFAPSPRG